VISGFTEGPNKKVPKEFTVLEWMLQVAEESVDSLEPEAQAQDVSTTLIHVRCI
jgi:hypothetical protein